MRDILFINGCINREKSRTRRLAQAYIAERSKKGNCKTEELNLSDVGLHPLTAEEVELRAEAAASGNFAHPIFRHASRFAAADEVVIAVPYWDLSFPASFKLYIEQICVNGITFRYGADGIPRGMTNVKSVTYITTAGGYIGGNNFGFDYTKGVFSSLFNIGTIDFISAEGLDIKGNDPEEILSGAIAKISIP